MMRVERIQQNLQQSTKESDETKKQMEEDADLEIEDLKEKYETKLAAEREAALRLKGENGIMKKKFTLLQKDIHVQKDEIQSLFDDKKELYATIASLEKDIAGLKREIRERDDTISDKEKRIYDLKKKNQELEKFKFVLDYKIKELKKQIEPREVDIADMKETIQKMDHELERYHKNNVKLDLTIRPQAQARGSAEGRQKRSKLGHLLSRRRDSQLPERPPRDVASDSEPQAARGVGEEPVPETRHDRGGGQDPGRGYRRRVLAAARVPRGKVHREPQAQAAQGHGDAPLGQHADHERKRQSAEGNQRAPPRDEAGASARARRRLEALSRRSTPPPLSEAPARGSRGSARNLKPRVRTSTSARTPRARLICSATSSRSFDWITS